MFYFDKNMSNGIKISTVNIIGRLRFTCLRGDKATNTCCLLFSSIDKGVVWQWLTDMTLLFLQYLGVWYEHSKYPFIAEIGKKCIYARYTAGDNDTVNVLNVGINRL